MTYLRNDGIVYLLKRLGTSQCVKGNGTASIVTNENINVEIVQIDCLHICHTMTSSIILLEKTPLVVTSSVFIQFVKIIPVIFFMY